MKRLEPNLTNVTTHPVNTKKMMIQSKEMEMENHQVMIVMRVMMTQ